MARSRSRSPSRDQKQKPRMDRGGFKWKQPSSKKKENHGEENDDGILDRGGKRRKERHEAQGRITPPDRQKEPEGSAVSQEREIAPDNLQIASKFGAAAAAKVKPIPKAPSSASTGQSVAVEKSSNTKSRAPTGPMMLVTINDRLGTKKEVPCLGSDTIGDFKKLVAMQIGRKPHEIMLKRQSERPLKDQLTLDDYEISSGVQLDLELNTGD